MDWLEKTQDTPLDELKDEEEEAAINAAPLAEGAVAMSLVCNECGKKFRSQAAAEFHASKTYVILIGWMDGIAKKKKKRPKKKDLSIHHDLP